MYPKKQPKSAWKGRVHGSGPDTAQAAQNALWNLRKQHYKGECFDKGSKGEMDMKRLAKIHSVPAPQQGKPKKSHHA